MSTTHEAKTDLEAVCLAIAAKRPVDPEIAKRVQERSKALRVKFEEELSVKLIRESREE